MAVEPTNGLIRANTNRKVWVINHDTQPYVEIFRGETITVPPNDQKKLLLPYLKAERFLSQPAVLYEQLPNGQPKADARGKQLAIVELTTAEKKKIEGVSKKEIQLALEAESLDTAKMSTELTKKSSKAQLVVDE